MKNKSWFGKLLVKEVYLGDKEKNGRLYQRYKLIPRLKYATLIISIILIALSAFIVIVTLYTLSQE